MTRGFTLVEIVIVTAIIIVLAAIGIPNLLRARFNANESAAVLNLSTISTQAQIYRGTNLSYPIGLASMVSPNAVPPYINSVLGGGLKQGYSFELTGATNTFTVKAYPEVQGTTGSRSFFVDETGVIKWSTSSNVGPGDSALE